MQSTKDLFEKAVNYIKDPKNANGFKPDNSQKLQFYAIYKQATEGPCKGPAPSRLKIVEKAKYDAWKQLGDISKEDAMKKYIEELTKLSPNWNTPTPKL